MTTLDDLEGEFGAPGPRRSYHVETDDELIECARNANDGGTFRRLWEGDATGFGSASEADYELAKALLYWTKENTLWADRLFRRSGLMRDKWDDPRGAGTWGSYTLDKALEHRRSKNSDPFVRTVPLGSVGEAVFNGNGHKNGHTMETLEQDEPNTADDFISAHVRHAMKRTDAPQSAHELVAVGVLSALAGPRVRLPLATSIHGVRLSIWVMYIGNSTDARKTTTLNFGQHTIAEVLGEKAILNWEGSLQGILQRLAERDGLPNVFFRDEYSGLMAQMNRAGHLAGLPQLFIRAFDGLPLENVRTKKRNKDGERVDDTDRVREPYLTKITATTWDAFVERATIDNVLDGFLARFTFVTGAAEPRPIARLTEELEDEQAELIERASAFHSKASRLNWVIVDEAVYQHLWELEQAWSADAATSSHPSAAGPALKRLAETVLKVAALMAIDRTPEDYDPIVTAALFQTARRMAERWKQDALKLIDALGATTFMRNMDAVLTSVSGHIKGIARSALLRLHRNIRARDFDEILTTLIEREDIEAVQEQVGGKGPRPVVYYPFGHAPRTASV